MELDRTRRAIGGGVAGTIVMAVVLLVGEAEAQFELGVGPSIARFVGLPDLPVLGLFVFFGFGMFVWPLVFMKVESWLEPLPGGEDPAVRGMAFSVPIWLLYVLLGMTGADGLIFYLHLSFTLFAHLLYGFTLGAVYYSLSEEV